MFSLFERAEALGVFIAENDFEKLLNAIHEQESKLMDLRHDVQRRIAGIHDVQRRIAGIHDVQRRIAGIHDVQRRIAGITESPT
jgi:hypothetical protein